MIVPWFRAIRMFFTQRRCILTLLVFLGYFNIYALRVNMSIGIVAMTRNKTGTLPNGTEFTTAAEFDWDNRIQGYVLSSFFYGYITTQLLGGVLGKKFGGKIIFGGGVACTAIITLVTPWLAELSVFALLTARILMGVFEGVTFSSLYTIWSHWIPPAERTRATIQSNSGSYTGTVFAMIFFAYLAETIGWRSIFWFSGGLGLIWLAAWMYWATNTPEEDLRISEEELQYIKVSLQNSKPTQTHRVQWKRIFCSRAVLSLEVAMFCATWGFYTLLTLLPKYFNDVFHYDIAKSGLLSALPYVAIALMMQICGYVADKIIIKKWLTVTQTRKTFMTVGFLAQTVFMIGAAFCDQIMGNVFCLVMAVGLESLAIATISVNVLDIAPLHSGIVIGIVNTWGTVPGIVSPIIAGYIISTDHPAVEQWRVVFYITAALYLFGSVFYAVFGTGERQTWDMELQTSQSEPSYDIITS